MDPITKALKKLRSCEREVFVAILQDLQQGHFASYDVQKLKGQHSIFRLRKGAYRIIFRIDAQGEVFILAFERRSDTTYRKW